MKALRKKITWLILLLFLLPVLLFGYWYSRQVRQNNLDHALIEAVKKNDVQKAIALLNEGADANAVDKLYQPKTLWSVLKEFWNRSKAMKSQKETEAYSSALMIATSWYRQRGILVRVPDNPVLVKALLEHGANPNVSGEDGTTPLVEACDSGRLETVRLLLEHGANPNAQSQWEITPLMGAFSNQNAKSVPCLRLLIEHRATVNATNDLKQTALIFYIKSNSSPSIPPIQYLLQNGGKVSIKDMEGKTALDYARDYKDDNARALIPLLEEAFNKEQAQKGGQH